MESKLENLKFIKKSHLEQLIKNPSGDSFELLRLECIKRYGLINNDLRKCIWPFIFGIKSDNISLSNDYKNHIYYNQVCMDIERTLKRFPPGLKENEKIIIQNKALHIIMNVLHDDNLHYYQGYHDIALTLLLIVDEHSAFLILNSISHTVLKDFLRHSMDSTNSLLAFIYPILSKIDKDLASYLESSTLNPPIFCLSHFITWFSRALGNNILYLARVYEFIMASADEIMPLYLCATFIALYLKTLLYQCKGDMPLMHSLLSGDFNTGCGIDQTKILTNSENTGDALPTIVISSKPHGRQVLSEEELENVLMDTSQLFVLHPPITLENERLNYLKRCQERDLEEKHLNDEKKRAYEEKKKIRTAILRQKSLGYRVLNVMNRIKPTNLLFANARLRHHLSRLQHGPISLTIKYRLGHSFKDFGIAHLIGIGVSIFVALMAITVYFYIQDATTLSKLSESSGFTKKYSDISPVYNGVGQV